MIKTTVKNAAIFIIASIMVSIGFAFITFLFATKIIFILLGASIGFLGLCIYILVALIDIYIVTRLLKYLEKRLIKE